MKYPIILALLLPIAALSACQQQTGMTEQAQAKSVAAKTVAAKPASASPVIVELFQSQGCSSCPPANAALNAVADRSDVIALNFSVTYWDRLGWKDIFGDPAYTQRQYDYAHSLGDDNVYTPQVVLNGKRAIVGNKPGELGRAIAATAGPANGPVISSNGTRASIGAGRGNAAVWLVRYDPRLQNVAIRSGENVGKNLPHKNIVRELNRLGSWNGGAANYTLPKAKIAGLKSVVLVQSSSGAILSGQKI